MQIIDGKLVAKTTREEIAKEVAALPQEKCGRIGLAVILVGDDPASQVYVRNKINGCAEVGIASTLVKLPADVTFDEVAGKIRELNADPEVNGILLQLPVPGHLDEAALLTLIDPAKDVDGCHFVQKGKLWTGQPELIPCTPYGVMKLLDFIPSPSRAETPSWWGAPTLWASRLRSFSSTATQPSQSVTAGRASSATSPAART